MNPSPFRLLGICLLAACWTGAWAAPQVVNPSFEESKSLAPTGVTSVNESDSVPPITGWVTSGNCGINPAMTGISFATLANSQLSPLYDILEPPVESALDTLQPNVPADLPGFPRVDMVLVEDFVFNSFANNGKVPDKTNVVFLSSGSWIKQNVSGFSKDRTYRVHCYVNGRNAFDPSAYRITLGGTKVAEASGITSVEPAFSHEKGYLPVDSDEWVAPRDGSFELMISNPATGNGALMIDLVSVEELGDARIISATRPAEDEFKVRVVFSAPMNAADLGNSENYAIDNGVFVGQATVVSPTTVELSTTLIDDPSATYTLLVQNIRDGGGLRMTSAHSTHAVDIPVLPPPRLTLERSADSIAVSWPAAGYAGWLLREATNLEQPDWTFVDAQKTNGLFVYKPDPLAGPRYYRLTK